MLTDLVEARQELLRLVDDLLARLEAGDAPVEVERQRIDVKEEPGRRGPGGVLLPAERHNLAAADYVAREVCCLANTPGGGAILLGIEDATWQALGTGLDEEWLRHRVYQLVDVAPAIEARLLQGQRVLAILVAEAPEPVEDPEGHIRWRVHDHCVPVDRSEWWLSRQDRGGFDLTAKVTKRGPSEITPGSLLVVRKTLADAGESVLSGAGDDELLRRLGALSGDNTLTQAAVMMFCSADRTLVSVSRHDAVGGNVIGRFDPEPALSLIEQIAEVEARLDAYNSVNPVLQGLAEEPVRSLPPRAVREAVMNGLVHRDWLSPLPTTVTWIEADSQLEVVSPGGFNGGVTADTVLTQRHSRYPALADLFRALRLVDKQGVGVDRMYREMIILGHQPPAIDEQAGPTVRTVLRGGSPFMAVFNLMRALRPAVRQNDVRVVLLVDHLLHHAFVTLEQATGILQCTQLDAQAALEAAEQTLVEDRPLVHAYKDTWVLGHSAIGLVRRASRPVLRRRGLLTYVKPPADDAVEVVRQWLACHERMTSGDYASLTRTAQPNGTRVLSALVGDVLEKGPGAGRNSHFVLKESPRR